MINYFLHIIKTSSILHKDTIKEAEDISLAKTKIPQEVKIIRNFVLRYKHKNPAKKFTVRQMDDGVGVWRT